MAQLDNMQLWHYHLLYTFSCTIDSSHNVQNSGTKPQNSGPRPKIPSKSLVSTTSCQIKLAASSLTRSVSQTDGEIWQPQQELPVPVALVSWYVEPTADCNAAAQEVLLNARVSSASKKLDPLAYSQNANFYPWTKYLFVLNVDVAASSVHHRTMDGISLGSHKLMMTFLKGLRCFHPSHYPKTLVWDLPWNPLMPLLMILCWTEWGCLKTALFASNH